jgi:hypothetical protein
MVELIQMTIFHLLVLYSSPSLFLHQDPRDIWSASLDRHQFLLRFLMLCKLGYVSAESLAIKPPLKDVLLARDQMKTQLSEALI